MQCPPSSNKPAFAPRATRRARGFTLIELMIGMLIGLLASLAVTQVMVNSEGQKRTTTSGSDAQVNGALALSTLQRAIQPAGYGIAANPVAIGCSLTATIGGAAIAGFPATLAPVTISQGAAGAPDTIRVLASGKTSYSVPLRVVSPGYNPASPTLSTGFPVTSARSVAGPTTDASGNVIIPGDLMVAVISTSQPCEMFQVTSNVGTNPVIPRVDNTKWNATGKPAAIYGEGNFLVNMGQMIDQTYSIGTSTLQVKSLNIANDSTPTYPAATELFPNIVNIKAMYGKDTNADGVVDVWDNTTPTTNAGWLQVLAIRLAVVSRSTQYEKEAVTTANPQWDVGTAITVNDQTPAPVVCGTSKCLTLKVDTPSDWTHYRYKVFETVIPLRNMIWNS